MKLIKLILPVLAAAILFPVSIHAKSGKSVRSTEQWSQEYFSEPFHATFTADASALKYSDGDTYFIFYRDGLARIFHSSVYPVYECYAYQTDGNSVTLRGICTIKHDAVNFRKLEAVPDDIRLQFTGYGKNATLKGQDNGGVSYSLENMTEGHINRMYNGADLNDMIASIDASRKWDTEKLWLVDSGYGTPAVTATYEGHALTSFPDGAIISGIPDPEDPRYILVDYIKGQKLYVDTHDLRKIGSKRQLDEILYADASACLPFYKWTGSFEEKIRETDSSGYLNGWKAGRQMATVFLPLLLVLAILLILNKIFSEPAWPDILYYVTSSVLMLTTIFEIWYAISLKTDMLWFIFDPLTFVHGFAAAIGSLIFICIQLDLILITQKNLLEFNDTYSRCPSWLEWLIAVPAMIAGIPLVLFGNALAGIGGCCLLAIAALPRLIGYISHSSHETPILPFMLLCYPVKFILFIPLFILIILKETDKYKVTAIREDEEEHKTVHTVNLTKFAADSNQTQMKNHICFIMILSFLWLLASCRNAGDTALSSSDYCLIFYGSGGDEAHTATIEGYRNAIETVLPESDAAVTWILKSDKADEQTFRYFSTDGTFRKDSTWTGDTAFDITSSANLAEFIKWSASRFPDRNYVLVTAGHGTAWRPDPGHEGEYGLLYDGTTRRSMSAEDLAKGIEMSEVKIETILTNNCLQGSVETLAEWSGYADYVVYGNSYLPDLGGDYPYFIKLLDGGSDMRCILHDYVRHCGDVFNNVLYPFEDGGSSLTAMDLTHFDAILSAAGKAFAEMGRSMERTSTVTDPPCEYGRSFADGYRAALNSSLQMDMLGSPATHDLYDFLYNSVLFTGHPELFCCLGEFRDALEQAVILNMHNMNLDSHKLSFNVCTEPDDFTGENLEAYRSSRFDQATGWSDFYTRLIGKDHMDDLKGLISE